LFCRKEGKWEEVPYVQLFFYRREDKWAEAYTQLFFYLRNHPKWLGKYKLDPQTLSVLCRKPPYLAK
jgi:hypothetical protein